MQLLLGKVLVYSSVMSPKLKQRHPSIFAKRLEELRKGRQLTQEQLAEKLGLSRAVIGYYEAQSKNPRLDTIYKISTFFGVPPEYLISESILGNGKPGPATKLEQQVERIKILPLAKQRMIVNMIEAALNSD